MMSFITWEPAIKVPAQPTTAHFQACGARLIRNSETIWRLPGGKYLVKSVTRSSMLVWLPQRLGAIATMSRSVGKNARNRLYAMACEIMLHGGNTRRNTRALRLAKDLAEIIAHQYKRGRAWRGIVAPSRSGPEG